MRESRYQFVHVTIYVVIIAVAILVAWGTQ